MKIYHFPTTEYDVTDKDGNPVVKGTKLFDFRGDPAWFVRVSRGPEYNGTPKVNTVRRREDMEDRFKFRENYAGVFDLKVTPVQNNKEEA